MTKYYGYFRISTIIYNYGTDDIEIGDSNVYFKGIFDLETALKIIEKDYKFENDFYERTDTLTKTDNEYKVLGHLSNKFAYQITEFFDDFETNIDYGQPVFEQAMINY